MKILVLNPPGPYCRAGSRWPHKRASNGLKYNPFPFFIAYATSTLLKAGYEADIKDCIALEWDRRELLNYTSSFNPDLIVMETSAPSYYYDIETLKRLKVRGRKIVAVGSHASATSKEHIRDGFDYVIIGEYEISLLKLVQHLDGKVKRMPRSVYHKKNQRVSYSKLIDDLDSLPWPPWNLMPMKAYNDPFCFGKNVAVMSSRGCIHNCSFCTIALFYGRPGCRLRDPVKVCDEISYLVEKYKPDDIYFEDDSITIFKKHIIAMCKEYKKRKFGVPFSCMGDCAVDNKTLKIMAEAGCRAFKFGVESFDPKVLKMIPKHITIKDVKRVVKRCKELGIKTHPTFVLGLPGETLESARNTVNEAFKLDTDTLQFSTATPYPGTRLYKMAEENGWLSKKGWKFFDGSGEVVISYPEFTSKEIMDIYKNAWVRWERRLVFKKPGTLYQHLYGKYRREGAIPTLRMIISGTKKLVKGEKIG
ncbi:MAG: radical SAM protein [Candidatus Aenigmatarchaeota archaeon]